MNFADEAYVRIYLRDTINWKMLKWEGKCTLLLLLRKVDRAGVLDLGEFSAEMGKVVAALIELPEEIVAAGLADMLKQKAIVLAGQFLVMPHFIEAQEAVQSDRIRKAEQRARHRDRTLAVSRGLVTLRDNPQPPADPSNGHASVTARDEVSHDDSTQRDHQSRGVSNCPVTPDRGHSSRAESTLTSLTEQSRTGTPPTPDGTPGAILRELQQHPSLSAVATLPVAEMLSKRFFTAEIQRGVKLPWILAAIGECAADSSAGGFTAETLTGKLRRYCDHARAPSKANGHARYAQSDAVIESRKNTPAEEAALKRAAEERIAQQKKHRELLEKGKPNAD